MKTTLERIALQIGSSKIEKRTAYFKSQKGKVTIYQLQTRSLLYEFEFIADEVPTKPIEIRKLLKLEGIRYFMFSTYFKRGDSFIITSALQYGTPKEIIFI
jgi:hypothetical protein